MRRFVNVYTKQVKSVLELSVPAWQSRLSEADKMAIERVQKASLRIILGDDYVCYQHALDQTSLVSLDEKRIKLKSSSLICTKSSSEEMADL